jgi:hypothetical protein
MAEQPHNSGGMPGPVMNILIIKYLAPFLKAPSVSILEFNDAGVPGKAKNLVGKDWNFK